MNKNTPRNKKLLFYYSPYVDKRKEYRKKYWSNKQESLTVKCRSTKGIVSDNLRNAFRSFLYIIPENFVEEFEIMKDKDSEIWSEEGGSAPEKEDLYRALRLNKSFSIRIRAYEKEFFYLKCLKLEIHAQVVLRVLLRLSRRKKFPRIFTSPGDILSLLSLQQTNPILSKNVKFELI